MDKFEKLVTEIMKEAEADGEAVTREEAEEMAKMELGAKEIKRYEQAETKERKPSTRVRKVDKTKKAILAEIKDTLDMMGASVEKVKTETEITFTFEGVSYTVKLTKHRPPKNK